MNEPVDKPAPTATGDPFMMRGDGAAQVIKRYLQLRHQLLHINRLLEAGADPLDTDILAIQIMWRFMRPDPVLEAAGARLPSGQFWRALSDMQDGGRPDYFKSGNGHKGRPKLATREHVVGMVAHLVETLVVGEAIGAGDAAIEVAKRLDKARLRVPDGGAFTADRVTDWHEYVVYTARRTDDEIAWQTFSQLQAAMMRCYPEHKGWNRSRLLEWLDKELIPRIVGLGYFPRAPE